MADELKPTTVEEREVCRYRIAVKRFHGQCWEHFVLRLLADIKRRDERIEELEAAQRQTYR